MSLSRLWALAALALLLPTTFAAPAAATDPAPEAIGLSQDLRDAEVQSSSFAVQGCFTDPEGDTARLPDLTPEYSERADITEFCIDHRSDATDLRVVIPLGTDPATDPGWDDNDAGIAMNYTSADGSRRELQISTQRQNRQLEYIVLEGSFSPTIVCSGPARFEQGGVYFAAVPSDCLSAPDTIEAQVSAVYDGFGSDGVLDRAPFDGGIYSIPRSTPAGADSVTRLAGSGRIETAVEVSEASFDDGEADVVLLAAAGNFPDAVVGAPLAAYAGGPVLLVNTATAPQVVRDEALRALGGPGDVRILGGTSAVSSAVAQAFSADGHTVTRLSGDGRIDTSIQVAEAAIEARGSAPRVIFLAEGGTFPDALLAGAYAPTYNGVAVLVNASSIPASVQDFTSRYPDADVVGIGPKAAALTPEDNVTSSNPGTTSAILARLVPGVTEVGIATFENFPDGLAGGAYAARRGIPLLLSPTDVMGTDPLDYLDLRSANLTQVTLFGGPAALSDVVAAQAAQHVEGQQ